jgi:hypothetical protein
MLDPWFESNGLVDANQVLAYFAVSKLGEPPVDGITDTNPEGLTAAFGNWGPAVAARLQNGGLTCKVCSFIRIILTNISGAQITQQKFFYPSSLNYRVYLLHVSRFSRF